MISTNDREITTFLLTNQFEHSGSSDDDAIIRHKNSPFEKKYNRKYEIDSKINFNIKQGFTSTENLNSYELNELFNNIQVKFGQYLNELKGNFLKRLDSISFIN